MASGSGSRSSLGPVAGTEEAGLSEAPMRVAYLLGGRVPSADKRDWSETPKPEYARFAERNRCSLLDYSFLDESRSGFGRMFRDRKWPNAGLAIAAADVHRDYDAFLVSGEDVGLPLAVAARLRGIRTPIYIITHGSYFRSPRFRRLMQIVRRFPAVHFLCLSESLRCALRDRFGVDASRAHNAGYGVDIAFFRASGADASRAMLTNSADPSQALIASAGTANRDYNTLVRAVTGIDAELRIAADSAWFPTAVDISNATLPANIEVRSYGNYRRLRDLYDAASFIVVPLYPAAHASGFAVIIEAMAMGKSVITTRTEACSDFIIEGETGCYVPPCDPEALSAAIRRCLREPDWVRTMGANARRLIEEKYSLDGYCARIEGIIQNGQARQTTAR